MKLLAIDPGSERSGFVEYEPQLTSGGRGGLLAAGVISNEELLAMCYRHQIGDGGHMAIELVNVFGMANSDVYRTCIWHGRFLEAWGAVDYDEITRNEIKLHLCGTARSDDSSVRAALCARWGGESLAVGGKGRGRAKTPLGPLHGVTSHAWSALAVAVTWSDLRRRAESAQNGTT